MRGKIRLVAEVAAAADHCQVDAGASALHRHGQDIDIAALPDFLDGLALEHRRQRPDLVAHRRGLFELEPLGVLLHLLLQSLEHLLLPALQEARGIAHVARVVLLADRADARRRAAVDLVQQARPRAVVEDGVLAGPQLEYLLQDLHALAHRMRARERAEVLVALVGRAAVVRHARIAMRRQLQQRIRLVVAEQDVVARRQCLDQVVLEQQRLGLAADHRGVDAGDARHHHRDARRQLGLVEIARDALLQVARLADIEHAAGRVVIAVDAGKSRQRGDHRAGIEAGFQLRLRSRLRLLRRRAGLGRHSQNVGGRCTGFGQRRLGRVYARLRLGGRANGLRIRT